MDRLGAVNLVPMIPVGTRLQLTKSGEARPSIYIGKHDKVVATSP